MGFWDYIRQKISVTHNGLTAIGGGVIHESNGVTEINSKDEALRVASFYRCVDALSKSVSVLPLHVYRNSDTGVKNDADHPIDMLLRVLPNSTQTTPEFLSQIVADIHIHGNALILIKRSGGVVKALELADPATVDFAIGGRYRVQGQVYNADSVIHIKNTHVDRYTGLGISTIRFASRALGLSHTADKETGNIIGNGGRMKGVFTSQSSTLGIGAGSEVNNKSIVDQLNEKIKSNNNAVEYVSGDLKFIPFSMSPVDTQLQEVRRMSVLDICRFFGVHPDKVYAGQASNYKASAEAQSNYLTDSVYPLCLRISKALTATLIPEDNWGRYFVDFDYRGYLSGDPVAMADYMAKVMDLGAVTINDVRTMLRLGHVAGGDTPLLSVNRQSLEMLTTETNELQSNTTEQ